jgi:hypothetical protein
MSVSSSLALLNSFRQLILPSFSMFHKCYFLGILVTLWLDFKTHQQVPFVQNVVKCNAANTFVLPSEVSMSNQSPMPSSLRSVL